MRPGNRLKGCPEEPLHSQTHREMCKGTVQGVVRCPSRVSKSIRECQKE